MLNHEERMLLGWLNPLEFTIKELIEALEDGEVLAEYQRLHPDANLTQDVVESLHEYLTKVFEKEQRDDDDIVIKY